MHIKINKSYFNDSFAKNIKVSFNEKKLLLNVYRLKKFFKVFKLKLVKLNKFVTFVISKIFKAISLSF